jgi:hypothetical protein
VSPKDHQQQNGIDRRDRGPSSNQKTLSDKDRNGFQLRHSGNDTMDPWVDQEELDQFPKETGLEQRPLAGPLEIKRAPSDRMAMGERAQGTQGKRAL